jgi:rRNA-processing protein FCF1
MDVLCDTSFLMALVSAPVKRLEKVEAELGGVIFLVPSIVVAELEKLEKRTGPKRSHIAKMAREISTSKFEFIELSKAGHVDEAILEYAKVSKCVVATLDRSLRDKLLNANTPVISLSNNRLIIAYPRK